MILRHYLNQATQRLSAAGIDAPRLSAQLLAAHALGCRKVDLVLRAEQELGADAEKKMEALMDRRAQGEPVAYIVGSKEFFGRDFVVTPATLIPRPETEDMVEKALEEVRSEHVNFADLGTGSGCIAVTLAAERPTWRGAMLDISAAALRVAVTNADSHGVGNSLCALQGDLQELPFAQLSFDLIISNPPYISGEEFAELSHEVRDFEPATALTPEHTGLAHIRAIARQGFALLKDGGYCLVEHGYKQGHDVITIFTQAHTWRRAETCRDLAGLDRFCLIQK